MKKWVIVCEIILIIILIIFLGIKAYEWYESKYACTIGNTINCNKNCNTDNDCKFGGCQCINNKEKMKMCTGIFIKMCVFPNCLAGECKCINNKCEFVQSTNIGLI